MKLGQLYETIKILPFYVTRPDFSDDYFWKVIRKYGEYFHVESHRIKDDTTIQLEIRYDSEYNTYELHEKTFKDNFVECIDK